MEPDKLKQLLIDKAQAIIEKKHHRAMINEDIANEYLECEKNGIPKLALKDTIAHLEMTDEQRASYDNALRFSRQAMGIPIQADLFD